MYHKLRQLRLQRGISQTFISKKLGYTYASGYSNIENGRVRLKFDQAKIIADILNVPVDELVDRAI
ncbi:hypothetical protein PACILC2_00930 [Paenibacillus cisolokensis]|uniref:HTH cro/C1-type domain-containing protein n=1 Tax=Paenibacillus cisolokensis TaxID=1658519 RepID=A0ABQ4N033_9BACL|nr:helix-turn-helix transcriptional regulator [Paenibacillus cisolokensis]GIQ61525.1 hypothetical protein PACILC2_00930 [Paenibacillus cisolokensis]